MTSLVMLHVAALALAMGSSRSSPLAYGGQAADAKPLRHISMPVTGDWHTLGSASAPLTLVEFTDYECPLCRAFHDETLPAEGAKLAHFALGALLANCWTGVPAITESSGRCATR